MNTDIKSAKETILIIEDEAEIAEMIQAHLADEGFEAKVCHDPKLGLAEAEGKQPSLILLDVIMPGMSGIEICQRLKSSEQTRAIPIIFLTGQSSEPNIVSGLELGADDYLTKPFSYNVLVARIRAVLRRANGRRGEASTDCFSIGPIQIDIPSHEVTVDGQPVALTMAEFQLLTALARNPGRVQPRKALLKEISKSGEPIIERNVDVHIGTLRKKLGRFASTVLTVRGIGYKLRV